MRARISALLVHGREDRLQTMKPVLEALSVSCLRVRSCREVETRLAKIPPPHLVLTDTELPDGSWREVLALAAELPERVSVIVVSPVADMNLYLDVMNQGAYDFVTESFTVPELVHVLRCAVDNAVQAREPKRALLRQFELCDAGGE
jgi:DNA-binding NtrC family response regulator